MPSPADDFVSKRDGWLVAVIWGSVAIGAAALAPVAMLARQHPLAVLALLGVGASLALGPWALYGTGYAFGADALLVRSGPFRWRVPFAEITRVEPSGNPLSSPACSLDRLLLQYGARKLLVSPLARAEFLSRLAGVCPHLRLEGERLLAADSGGGPPGYADPRRRAAKSRAESPAAE